MLIVKFIYQAIVIVIMIISNGHNIAIKTKSHFLLASENKNKYTF